MVPVMTVSTSPRRRSEATARSTETYKARGGTQPYGVRVSRIGYEPRREGGEVLQRGLTAVTAQGGEQAVLQWAEGTDAHFRTS